MQKPARVLLLAALCIASCATGKGEVSEKAALFGMIYDEDNQPCAAVALSLDGAAVKVETGPVTDIRGRFVLPEVSRGEHLLLARKEGYEDLSLKVTILNRTDALFLRMISFSQLLAKAEKAIEERKWEEAQELLGRAAKLDTADSVLLYLRAVKAYRLANYPEAVGWLNDILDKGIREPSVYLFLADIFEKKLNDPQSAIRNLRTYLMQRADSDVEKRLALLKAAQE